jgi:CRP-like cAMP-binding protein
VPSKRVIIRQGQQADSFYFIISGQAMVTIMEENPVSGETTNRIVAILKEGTCFGVG